MSKFGDNLLSARVKSISPRHIQPQPLVNILTEMLKFSIFSIYCDTLEEVVKKFIHMMNHRKKNSCNFLNKRTVLTVSIETAEPSSPRQRLNFIQENLVEFALIN